MRILTKAFILLLIILPTMLHCFSAIRVTRPVARKMCRFVSDSKIEAFQQAQQSSIRMPCVILVNPYLDANVGSVSRAMLNFGMHELRVVNPECNILSETATTLAVGSVEILKNAKVYSSLAECVADLDIVVATTSRKHSINQIIQTPAEAATEMINAKSSCNAGIVFGRERSGLTGEELALANRRVAIPSFQHFGVLNMAQAVNILAYECWSRKLAVEETATEGVVGAGDGEPSADSALSASSSGSSVAAELSKDNDVDALVTSGELGGFMQRLLEAMGRSRRYGKVHVTAAAAGGEGGDSSAVSSGSERGGGSIATEHDGVSGLTKKNERRLATVFQRANMNKAELRLMQGMLARLVD